MTQIRATALLLPLLALASLATAFPFWLEAPSRSNPNDPKSPQFRALPIAPVATNTAVAGTPTQTRTSTATATWTYSNTHTQTVVGTSTNTVGSGGTSTPTSTATPTQTVPVGTATHTHTATASATAGGATPTFTPTLTHGSLVADFENNATNDRTLWNDAPVLTVKDGIGSTLTQNPWTFSSGVVPPGTGNSSAYAACISGNLLREDGALSQYPYCFMALELVPSGSAPSATGVDVDLSSYAPNNGLKFDYRAGAAGIAYKIKLVSTVVTDYGYYEYVFTPADTAWHTLTVYFPGTAGAAAVFSQPGWAAAKPFDKTKVGAIMVQPVPSTSSAVAYDLCVDNLTFAVAVPASTPTFGPGTMVMDFDTNSSANDVTLSPFQAPVSTNSNQDAGYASTINAWSATAGANPGYNSTYCGQITGTLAQQNPGLGQYPYAVMELLLAPMGYGHGGGFVDITPYAPNKRLIFEYKAGAGAVGVQYSVQLVTQNFPSGMWNFYEYFFTPADSNWHTLVVYFPDASYTPKLAQSYGSPVAWDPTQAGEILLRAVPQNAGPVNFDLYVDDIRFD